VRVLTILALVLLTLPLSVAQWSEVATGSEARFRGVSAVDGSVVWASGTTGTVVRSLDGGATWTAWQVEGAAALDLRDIDAFDAETAYALSIGSGGDSRIFKTDDGGAAWRTQFVNEEADGFFDAMAFWDRDRGLAVSDSLSGEFYVIRTDNGGRTWERVPPDGMPAALAGEGFFAASGTNVTTWGARHAWFGTGAAARSRVARTTDSGSTWQIVDTPLPAGPSAGIFSIAFRDADNGIVVGGDYRREDEAVDNAAVTRDGGRTWELVEGAGLSGFRSAVGYLPGSSPATLIAIGPSGADISTDDGRSWRPLEAPTGMHTLSFGPAAPVAWAAGEGGRVARFAALPSASPERGLALVEKGLKPLREVVALEALFLRLGLSRQRRL